MLHARPTSLRRALAVTGAAALALALPVAAAPATPHPEITVMTRNLYLGSSLTPAIDAETLPQFVVAVAQIYRTSVFTDFPTRASAVADEVAATQPDLIGLQEVSNWMATPLGKPTATPPSFDFLTILLDALAAKGLDYSVAGVVNNALIGPAPLVAGAYGCETAAPVPDCVVTFADRDVILVNDATAGLALDPARSGPYAAQEVLDSPAGPVSFDRGWVAVDGRYLGKSFRLVNTHLEVEDSREVQQAQAAELLAGPARGGQTILTGDFNSAADGSTTTSYAQLTAPQAYVDAWSVNPGDVGLTCCQDQSLTNPATQVRSRIDLILSRGPIRAVSAELVGDQPFRTQTSPPRPIWASDHVGVVATLQLR